MAVPVQLQPELLRQALEVMQNPAAREGLRFALSLREMSQLFGGRSAQGAQPSSGQMLAGNAGPVDLAVMLAQLQGISPEMLQGAVPGGGGGAPGGGLPGGLPGGGGGLPGGGALPGGIAQPGQGLPPQLAALQQLAGAAQGIV